MSWLKTAYRDLTGSDNMDLSSPLWDEGLADDIYVVLREKEERLPHYYSQSPELHLRGHLIKWLSLIVDKYNFCKITKHLAVCLLDYTMDRFSIDGRQIYLVAIGCLLIASKYEEAEMNIPRGCDLNRFVDEPGFSNHEFCNVELIILKFFNWNINIPTAAHFTDYFVKKNFESNYPQGGMSTSVFNQYVNYFLDISLQDHYYRDVQPSLVAAACIASTRLIDQAMLPWTKTLQDSSQYSLKDLRPIIDRLLLTHSKDKALQDAQSGLLTPPVTPQSKMSHSMYVDQSATAIPCPPASNYGYICGDADRTSYLNVVPAYSPVSPSHDIIYISDGSPSDSREYICSDKNIITMVEATPNGYESCC